MKTIETNILILGGGISGISLGHFYDKEDYLIVEKGTELGGYCRSFKVGDSIFDYSGHFLHFNNEKMKEYVYSLVKKHNTGEIIEHERNAAILLMYWFNTVKNIIDYPFQANIHQLDRDTFLKCLVQLFDISKQKIKKSTTFEELVRSTFGDEITDIFFKPYNEKMYCCKLSELDVDAMNRFIPKVSFEEIIENFREKKQFGYNTTFLYPPSTGIQSLVDAFVKDKKLNYFLNTEVFDIDIENKEVLVSHGGIKTIIKYNKLVNTLPLNIFTRLCRHKLDSLKSVDVTVFNITYRGNQLCIDPRSWVYVPERETSFYRVGFYSYMSKKEDTSMYVEISSKTGTFCKASLKKIDSELKSLGIIQKDAEIKDSQELFMSPGYVILDKQTLIDTKNYFENLANDDVYFTGRYGKWCYQSIEDNILDAKKLSKKL